MHDGHREYLKIDFMYECSRDELTPTTQMVLDKYGSWMKGLANNEILPYTLNQEHFLEVHAGKEAPSNVYEESWYEYRRHCLYIDAIKQEAIIGTGAGLPYYLIVKRFKTLACMGHKQAVFWLTQESIAIPKECNGFFPLTTPAANGNAVTHEEGESFSTGFGPTNTPTGPVVVPDFDDY